MPAAHPLSRNFPVLPGKAIEDIDIVPIVELSELAVAQRRSTGAVARADAELEGACAC